MENHEEIRQSALLSSASLLALKQSRQSAFCYFFVYVQFFSAEAHLLRSDSSNPNLDKESFLG